MSPTPPGGYSIAPARSVDVDAWLESLGEQSRDNGEGGVYFSPRPRGSEGPARTIEAVLSWVARLSRSPQEPNWFRLWLARHEASGAVVGHVDLGGARLPTELHRAELGIGIARPHRGVGLGPALLQTAIEWARATPGLDWIELGVFSANPRARRLYDAHGFVQIGTVPDRFRVDGVRIDDVRMALSLR